MRTVALLLLLSANASHAGTHCAPLETVAFSCALKSSKVVSLCLAKASGDGPARLSYRFGRPGAPELAFPTSPTGSLQRFRFAHYVRYQVDRTEVSFANAGVEYAVFDYFEGEETPNRVRGVRVTVDGGDRTLSCRSDVVSHLDQLEPLLPCDAENALSSCR